MKFKVKFVGRQLGAIGVFYPIEEIIQDKSVVDKETAVKYISGKYEFVRIVSVEQI